ncbi:glycerate kinase [Larsenimonas suaedae]|uniref:Glycerate kinase n=1 Tax=Larsenimonas suaedae TaxID=1851019 RepID=A0ABU1GSR1_9GAMM|nr:glycerate kinase [Larsenimonas suaedae]MCM2972155.1 glycerate kinase [Larsenimonas suaedae]MDR5895049.1 glycerate kinase [Larsenimonas suaedae]
MIILAPDSFKDALGARAAANAMAEGIRRADPDCEVLICPMGDGGEGTLDAVIEATGMTRRRAHVVDALRRPIDADWGWDAATRTAFIELAEAAGLQHLKREERNVRHTTTEGVGLLILEALDAGAEHIVLTLGGSATNDAGSGMMHALGMAFLDERGDLLPPGGAALRNLARIDAQGLDSRLAGVHFEAAVDVTNPLCGPRGASAVFGPQKGADEADIAELDEALAIFARVVAEHTGTDAQTHEGAGAAGGMGFAALSFFDAELAPGIDLVMKHVKFDQALSTAELVITGEGRLDGQSLAGKTPIGIARRAAVNQVPTIVLAGCLDAGWESALEEGVTAAFALADRPMTLEEALERCGELLADRSEAVFRLWRAGIGGTESSTED